MCWLVGWLIAVSRFRVALRLRRVWSRPLLYSRSTPFELPATDVVVIGTASGAAAAIIASASAPPPLPAVSAAVATATSAAAVLAKLARLVNDGSSWTTVALLAMVRAGDEDGTATPSANCIGSSACTADVAVA